MYVDMSPNGRTIQLESCKIRVTLFALLKGCALDLVTGLFPSASLMLQPSRLRSGDEGVHLLPDNLLDTPAPKSRRGDAKEGDGATAAGQEGGEGRKPLPPPQDGATGGGRPSAASGAASELGQLNGPASFRVRLWVGGSSTVSESSCAPKCDPGPKFVTC